ncbi:Endonuclease/exonuclease/phosphatase [Mycena rebaudengoi]|nr:Endonuclease/exonuclease/phosphatase [Mycena rebaudengoi]
MREEKIGALIVGEAHLDDDRCASLNRLFGRSLEIKYSKDPDTANARGVAIVLNRSLVNTDDATTTEIVPGRAILLETTYHDKKPLSILGIYAPNRPADNAAFWHAIRAFFETHRNTRKPDIFGGDFNVVEDPLDRLPARADTASPTSALDELKCYFQMVDGWRETYPTTRAYTFHSPVTGSQSRIDRIYIKRHLFEHAFDWSIKTVGIPTDHRMVGVHLSDAKAPEIGRGRWVWPAHVLRDKTLTKYIHDRGMTLQTEMNIAEGWVTRDPKCNVQTMWAAFKRDIGNKARERAKIIVPRTTRDIAELELKLESVKTCDRARNP